MVDFKKLAASKSKPRPNNPREIFNSLPKPPGINDLYASQAEVLDAWYTRRTDRDVVVKLHTGGGKTLVALLMAQSVMNELGEPVIYLAPTNQLVDQVIAKSREYGIATTRYVSGQSFPGEFYDGKAVMVGAYETLFNGRSRFGVRNSGQDVVKAGAIILDDAHVALSSVRKQFSLVIEAKAHPEIYADLAGRFRTAFADVGRTGTFADVTSGKDYGVMEVPSWAWQKKLPEVTTYLSGVVDEIDAYVWPLLRDNLAFCHCLFSRRSVTITPIFPPVDLLPTFEDCPRRIYMSATIADDSEIVRAFSAGPDAVGKPITSTSLAGVGERMILIPELMKLGGTAVTPMVKNIATKLAESKRGAAILSPSGPAAEKWADIATYPSKTKDVAAQIGQMQAGTSFGPVVLANRYDGIDLAGNACRFLVMDNLPQGTSDYDLYRMNVVADSAVSSLLAQRIEQGIGRGTRGGGDYCAVMLVGSKLVAWIGRKSNLAFLTASTRMQLTMGQEMSASVTTTKEVGETILKCLNRDPDWVYYHAQELADAAHAAPVNLLALRIAGIERKSFRLQRLGHFEKAIDQLEKLIADPDVKTDAQRRAWLSATAARIAYQMGEDDRGQRLQTYAFSVSNNHTPPKVRPAYIARPIPGKQSVAIIARLLEYDLRGAVIAEFDEAVAELVPTASAARYEEALANLGRFLGFEAERPEQAYKKGPDVLWRTDAGFDFVIEAKSKKQDNPLYKNDHAQLLEAEAWFKSEYPAREAVRVSALPEAMADAKASTAGSFAIRLEEINKLVGAFRAVLEELVGSPGSEDALRERCEAALLKANLKPVGIPKGIPRAVRRSVQDKLTSQAGLHFLRRASAFYDNGFARAPLSQRLENVAKRRHSASVTIGRRGMPNVRNHDFSSLSVKDLLEAREAYHVHLAHLSSVFSTAIGRYLIRDDDQNSNDPEHRTPPAELGPRRLDNASPRPWSWPCVLVFVSRWFRPEEIAANPELAQELVPSFLFLPDGRVVPTCVIQVDPATGKPAQPPAPQFKSDLVGGGFPIETTAQGTTHVGSIACLVSDGESVFALTNRHVAGRAGREIFAGFKNTSRRLGVSDERQLAKRAFGDVYPGWPGDRALANLDAGLVRIDDVQGWTAQVYGIGEVGPVWDLNVHSFRLDVIDCPVVAFGGASGLMRGRILGLFYRYKSVGGVDYVSDILIGARDRGAELNNYPGDSGTLWFEDDPKADTNANGARRLRPVALEWGGQAFTAPGAGQGAQFALGICLSTICRELDVELISDWNTGHTEYWGEWGHVKIGAYAASLIDASLPHLQATMAANAGNIGLDDALLKDLQPHAKGTFSPLADVADLVWRFTRHDDESNHFADMDKAGSDGRTLLDLCAADTANVHPDVWNRYYAGIGEDRRGALPFRVWQIFDEMVEYARSGNVEAFVCAGGILAHYVGDACQPLHISQYHHGHDLTDKPQAKVHSVYETTMIGRHGSDLLEMIPAAATDPVRPVAGRAGDGTHPDGQDAAIAVVRLMQRTVARLAPLEIVDLFDAHMGAGQVDIMWDTLKDRTAQCMQDGAKTLARIWESAWRAGGGEANAASGAFAQDGLRKLYSDPAFLPAYKLQDVVVDAHNRITGPATAAMATAPAAHARRTRHKTTA